MVDRDPRTKGQGSSRPDEGRHPADQRAQSSVARVDQVADNFNSDDIWQENSVLRYVERLSVDQPSPPTELQSPEEQTPQMMADMTELTRVPVVPAETAFNLTRTTDEYNNADRTIHLVEGQPLETGPQRGGLHGLGNLEASAVAGPTEVPGGREEHSAMSEVPAEPSDPTGGGRKRRTTEKDADPRPSRRQTLYAQRPLALAPDLSAANAGIIVGASTGDLVNRAAFRTVSAQDQARLDEIARQTPRQSRQSKGAWADALKAAHPNLSAADAAVIVGVVKRVIARRAAYRTVSAQDRARLDEIKAATPQLPGQSKGAWADALKAAHPDLSAADAAIIVNAVKQDIAKRTAFQTVSAQDHARLDEIARQTPQLQGQSKGAWADALKAAHPDLSAADAAAIVGAVKRVIARRAAFQTVSAQDQARLDEIARQTPRLPGQSKGAWADALKAAHPDLSAADAAIIVGSVKHNIVKRAAFRTVSAQDQARLDEIARQTPRQSRQSKGAWADALKAAHPDLSAADAATIVGALKDDIAVRAAFRTVSAQDQARLDEIAAVTPRQGRSNAAWADALKAAHPDLSAADAATIVGAAKDEIARRAAFRTVSAQDQARLDELARQTPQLPGQSNAAWADALKAAHPDLSAADAAVIVGAIKQDIAKRAAFRTVSAQDQARLDEIAAATPRQGGSNAAWADALKAAHPDLSAADAATILGTFRDDIARRAAFRTVSAQDQARLDEIKAATPQLPGQSKGAWADALKAAHPDLSAADAAIVVGAVRRDIAVRTAFQTVSAQDQARLDEIARQTPQLPGQSKGAWADALKAAHPDLSAADAAIIVGASKKRIARRAAFKVI
ncbi:hypothetical protein EFQ99_30955 [Rhizobium vallis]|uniref:Uncharacterized protein n=2 Tax=Rhizobium TaxID=379 RepID=A0A2A6J5U2_9HYPH|nr:hypothetical protein CO650_28155 [Rhizobium phaseoli]PDT01506.1 hypothetical protein CO666_24695 [Rhizobium chutanense]RUM19850.1 hypothetical protein EFQ99_30955 [Rhizobium vallis]